MQVYAHLFELCIGRFAEAWSVEGDMARHEEVVALPSLGGQRLRSGAVNPGSRAQEPRISRVRQAAGQPLNLSAAFFQSTRFQKADRYSALRFWYFR